MSSKARTWLRKKTHNGKQEQFSITPSEGGIVGSMGPKGLEFVERKDLNRYEITFWGLGWIEKSGGVA